ncbi:MAG: hypothetical protein LUE11_03445 [Clostridia bacterium]|nr:hypothetical protein [Clostridia bacterium]
MKIFIKKRFPLIIYVPNRLLCSRPVSAIIAHAIQRDGIPIDRPTLARLLRQCCDIFAQHSGLDFVEVYASDGTQIHIRL